MKLRILYEDPWVIAIDKPAGFYVHPPEGASFRISKVWNCMAILRDQVGHYVYPVHRLDRATSGVLLYARSPEAASAFQVMFQSRDVEKIYFAVTRGWVSEEGEVRHPLEEADPGLEAKDALTRYRRVATLELPISCSRYPTSRYSLVRVSPETGRFHQIRRHFCHLSHPLVGDTVYGDGKHNRLFKAELQLPGLWLKAHSLEFRHPFNQQSVRLESRWSDAWHRLFGMFGLCPWEGGMRSPSQPGI